MCLLSGTWQGLRGRDIHATLYNKVALLGTRLGLSEIDKYTDRYTFQIYFTPCTMICKKKVAGAPPVRWFIIYGFTFSTLCGVNPAGSWLRQRVERSLIFRDPVIIIFGP